MMRPSRHISGEVFAAPSVGLGGDCVRLFGCRQVGGAQQGVGSPSLAWLKDMPDTTHTSLGMPLAEFAARELA